jgi:hypothetical protein
MMRVRDALLIEGTTRFSILCYGIVVRPKLDAAYEALRLATRATRASSSQVHKLLDETWPNAVLLRELYLDDENAIPSAVTTTLSQMFDVAAPIAAVCMYDGAFGSYDDLFAEETASQTYAYCFAHGEPILALDAQILSSKEWRALIADCRARLQQV